MGCLATHDGCAAAPSRGDCLLQVRERKMADAAAAANANANRPADNSPARAARLVWLIVLLGLVTGGFTLCMVRLALASIKAQRTRPAAELSAVDNLSTEIDRGYADAQGAMQQRLALRAGPSAAKVGFGHMYAA